MAKRFTEILFYVLAIVYLFALIYRANWIFGDDHQFMATTLIGKSIYTFDNFKIGRFFPLAFIEFNIIKYLSNSPYSYYLWVCVKALITIFFLFNTLRLLNKNNKFSVYISMILFLCIPNVYLVFSDIIYPEASLIPLLAIFCWSYVYALKSQKRMYYILALIIANLSIYFKEPVFGVLIIFSISNWFLRRRELSRDEKVFHSLLVLSAIVFIFAYYFFVFKDAPNLYHQNLKSSLIKSIIYYSCITPILGMLLPLFIYRWLGKDRSKEKLSDVFFITGVSYISAYIVLRLHSSAYPAPAYVFLIIAVCYYMKYLSGLNPSSFKRFIYGMLMISFIIYGGFLIKYISINQFQRKFAMKDITIINEIARSHTQKLYIVHASNYEKPWDRTMDSYTIDVFKKVCRFLKFDNEILELDIENDPLSKKLIVVYKSFPKCIKLRNIDFKIWYKGGLFSLIEPDQQNYTGCKDMFFYSLNDHLILFPKHIKRFFKLFHNYGCLDLRCS